MASYIGSIKVHLGADYATLASTIISSDRQSDAQIVGELSATRQEFREANLQQRAEATRRGGLVTP